MSTETKNKEMQENELTSSTNFHQDEQYNIFDFFKEHTTLLVTCVSAATATMSVILHYAVGRMNYAYLEYWGITTLHANTNNQNELYTAICSLLFCLSLMIIHGLLSGTSDAFRYYNKLLLKTNLLIKDSKRLNKETQRKIHILAGKIDSLSPKENEKPALEEIKKKIDEYEAHTSKMQESTQSLIEVKRSFRRKIFWEIIAAIAFSWLLGSLSLILLGSAATIKRGLPPVQIILSIIALDLLIYFLPAYFTTWYSHHKSKKEETHETLLDLIDSGFPDFPIDKFVINGIKPMLSDKSLKAGLVKLVITIITLLFMMSAIGTTSAKEKRTFPLYNDDTTLYAIVYFSGSTVILEEAFCQDDQITIDTSKQRILTTEDLSYNMVSFESVTVNRVNTSQDLEQGSSSIKDFVDNLVSLFKIIRVKFAEVLSRIKELCSESDFTPSKDIEISESLASELQHNGINTFRGNEHIRHRDCSFQQT